MTPQSLVGALVQQFVKPSGSRWCWIAAAIIGLGVLSVLSGRYMFAMPGASHEGPLPAATADETELAGRLKRQVATIASKARNLKTPGNYAALEKSAAYIESELRAIGLDPIPQVYQIDGRSVRNIEVVIRASAQARTALVVGAHYDTAKHSPGANDNGSGCAALLEIARLMRERPPTNYDLRLVFFVNEEDPYFGTEAMGSYRYVDRLYREGAPIFGMISLETIGVFSDAPGSQSYPLNFGLSLPDKANFVAFIGMLGSRDFMHKVLGAFRAQTKFPTIGVVAPGIVPGVGWSDHDPFSQYGVPAIMITDTALFRYPHYHKPTDTPEKVDYEKLGRITKGVERALRELKP